MTITEVQVKLAAPGEPARMVAYCSMALDGVFAVHDLKVVRGNGGLLVCMPNRKHHDHCACGQRNPLTARYCSGCGTRLTLGRTGGQKLYHDVCHPITPGFRSELVAAVLAAVSAEQRRALAGSCAEASCGT